MNNDYLMFEHNNLKDDLQLCLNIVKEYIKTNNLILVGGQSIDYLLQIKNKKIYDEYNIPDYDCYSNDFYYHATQIASILCNKQLKNISCIPAIHVTTMRVKYFGYSVFDCTYIPQQVIKKLDIIQYEGFKLISPNNQKIDQFNSLSFLFDKTGYSENIYHRMKKDIERNKLLIDNYPITINNKTEIKLISKKIPIDILISNRETAFYDNDNKIKDIKNITISTLPDKYTYFESDENICLHGFLAYSIYHKTMKDTIKKNEFKLSSKILKDINNIFDTCIQTEFDIKDGNINFTLPENENICLINSNNNMNDIIKFIEKNEKSKNKIIVNTYSKLLDVKPVSKIINTADNNYELFDLFGRLLSSHIVKYDKYNLIVSNYNYILSYFLMKYYYYNKNDYYLKYYVSLQKIIKIANIISENINNDQLDLSLFNYSISTYGINNYNDSYYYYVKNFKFLIENSRNSKDKPSKIYIDYPTCEITKEFEILNSEFFKIDGEKDNDINITNKSHLIN